MLGVKPFHDDNFALVMSLHRNDLIQAGLPEQLRSTIDNNTLVEIADKLRDRLLAGECGRCLSEIIDEMGLKNKPDNRDESTYIGDDDDGYC